MNKTELVSKFAEVTGHTKKDAAVCVDTIFAVIADALARGEKVDLRGTIAFDIKDVPAKPEREGRNPSTNEPMTIPAKPATVKTTVKLGKQLKDPRAL